MRLTILFLVLTLVLTVTAAPAPTPGIKGFIKWVGRKLGLRHRAPPVVPPVVVNHLPVYSIGELAIGNRPDPILTALFEKLEAEQNVAGVYRLSCGKTAIEAAFNDLMAQYPAILAGTAAPHFDPNMERDVAANLVKEYLKKATNRLLTLQSLPEFASGNEGRVRAAIEGLPGENQIVLDQILEHIKAMVAKGQQMVDKSQIMTAENLAIVFGPNLFQEGGDVMGEGTQAKNAVEFMVTHEDRLFPEEN